MAKQLVRGVDRLVQTERHLADKWPRLHELLLVKLRSVDALDFSWAAVDGSHIRALTRVPRPDKASSTGEGRAANTT